MSKITSLSTTQQEKLNTHCQKLHDFILHSGKDLTREEVESYIEWIYSKIGKPKPIILIFDSYLAQKVAINILNNNKFRESQVESQVWSQVESQVRSQVRSQGLEFIEQSFGYGYESWWLTFTEYWKNEGIVKSDDFNSYLGLNRCGIWSIVYFEKSVFICKLPIKILKDERGRLHSVKSPSVQWRDGLDNYFIHGVGFEKDLWQKIVDRKLEPRELMKMPNTDQRFVALNHYGFERALTELAPKLIDQSKRGNKLYSIKFDAYTMKFLKYTDTVNGENRISFVKPEFDDADEAMAWKHNMTKNEYQNKLRVEA